MIKRAPFRDHSVITVGDTLPQHVQTTETAVGEGAANGRTGMRTSATMCGESIHHTDRMLAGEKAFSVTTTEERLISKLRSRDEEAFDAVVTEQHSALIHMAMRYVANRATAEEVVQETWMAMVQSLNRFEGRSSLHAWICAILIHKAKDRGVREKRHRPFSDFEYEDKNGSDATDSGSLQLGRNWFGYPTFPVSLCDARTPEKLLESKQVFACLSEAIEALPTGLQQVLILRDLQGVETKAVCEQLNISEANVYVRLHRARERVRRAVEITLR